jgi:hypothetical protein
MCWDRAGNAAAENAEAENAAAENTATENTEETVVGKWWALPGSNR